MSFDSSTSIWLHAGLGFPAGFFCPFPPGVFFFFYAEYYKLESAARPALSSINLKCPPFSIHLGETPLSFFP